MNVIVYRASPVNDVSQYETPGVLYVTPTFSGAIYWGNIVAKDNYFWIQELEIPGDTLASFDYNGWKDGGGVHLHPIGKIVQYPMKDNSQIWIDAGDRRFKYRTIATVKDYDVVYQGDVTKSEIVRNITSIAANFARSLSNFFTEEQRLYNYFESKERTAYELIDLYATHYPGADYQVIDHLEQLLDILEGGDIVPIVEETLSAIKKLRRLVVRYANIKEKGYILEYYRKMRLSDKLPKPELERMAFELDNKLRESYDAFMQLKDSAAYVRETTKIMNREIKQLLV